MLQRDHRKVVFPLFTLVLAAAGLGAGCAADESEAPRQEVPRNVRVLPLALTEITEYFEIAGPVHPVRGTDVSAEETGTVARIRRDKGELVTAGQVMLELDRRLLAADLDAAEARLKLENYNYDKTRQLYEAGKISRLEFLQSEAQFEQTRALRDQAQVRHDRAAVQAPFAGIVAERYVEPGQLVAMGMRVARVVDPNTLKLAGSLTEREVAWVTEGTAAEVLLEGTDRFARGRVVWVGFEASLLNGKFPVEIHIDNSDLAYRAGVIGRARIAKRNLEGVLAIPRGAIIPAGAEAKVFVVEGDRAHERFVELGPGQGLLVTVTAGLAVGDRVVVRGQRELVEGSLVHETEVASATDGSLGHDPDAVKTQSAGTRIGVSVEGSR